MFISNFYLISGVIVYLFLVVRPQPRRPPRARDRQAVQDRLDKVQRVCQGVDEEVRHVIRHMPIVFVHCPGHFLDNVLGCAIMM